MHKEEIQLNELIEELKSVHKRIHKNQNVKIISQLPKKETTISSDRTKIQQILSNLINNALKFTSEGFVKFGYENLDKEILFYVKDTGSGIPNKEFNKIFERFTQLETTQKKSGTGLGLSICNGFAELLGGEMALESEMGEGSTFYFHHPK